MRASREELPVLFGADPAALRGADWGDLRSIVVSLPAGSDVAPLLKGLPNDLCPCPHWGYVIKGQVRVSYASGQEVVRAGDLYYMPPGHTAVVEEDFEGIEFSPSAPHEQLLDVFRRNIAMDQTPSA
jgi:hypothetical protein